MPPCLDNHRNFLLLLLVTSLCLLTSGCATSISHGTMNERLVDAPMSLVLLDVRTNSEYRKGHLPGAVNISVFVLPFRLGRIPVKSKEDQLVVYCAHGPRAGLAGFILKVAGFKRVHHLEADLEGWRADGILVSNP
jgi:rhodanese-related sulfurtransferase